MSSKPETWVNEAVSQSSSARGLFKSSSHWVGGIASQRDAENQSSESLRCWNAFAGMFCLNVMEIERRIGSMEGV